jgi:hypothetical protein
VNDNTTLSAVGLLELNRALQCSRAIRLRCAQRVKRFTAFGTMEQSRGVARQLNDAIGAARALLKSSFTTPASTSTSRWPATPSVPLAH